MVQVRRVCSRIAIAGATLGVMLASGAAQADPGPAPPAAETAADAALAAGQLGRADAVYLTEVYAAGEAPIVAADGRALARALRVAGQVEPQFVANVADLPALLAQHAQAGDVVLCMGAGTIGALPAKLVALLDGSGQAGVAA